MDILMESNRLYREKEYAHEYPHCGEQITIAILRHGFMVCSNDCSQRTAVGIQ